MAFNIEEFKASGPVLGGARPSLFYVVIPDWPGSTTDSQTAFRFMCRTSSIPPSQIGAIDVPYFGRQIKLAGDRVYADWNVTIINDESYNIRKPIESWHSNMNQHIQNLPTGGVTPEPRSYKRDAVIRHYSKDGSVIATYTIRGMFPINISQMGLDWDATNQIQTFDVDFALDYWLPGDDIGLDETAFDIENARNLFNALV